MKHIAVVIPSYRVKDQILDVISKIGSFVEKIYVVDDKCPEHSGKFVEEKCQDKRCVVLYNEKNLGVGGATMRGFKEALKDKMDIVVKLDGDGQMDPKIISNIISPLVKDIADYSKGNRFYSLESLKQMPYIRLFGNAGLSFLSKVSSGYWNLMDPTNGYLAINSVALKRLPLNKIDNRYFFESDMLFRLNTIGAVVKEVAMDSLYSDEVSSLSIKKCLFEFPLKHFKCCVKRIFYNYFLRNFNVGSLFLVLSFLLGGCGIIFGGYHWHLSNITGVSATTGTVMISALSIIFSFQLLLSFLIYDLQSVPTDPLCKFF